MLLVEDGLQEFILLNNNSMKLIAFTFRLSSHFKKAVLLFFLISAISSQMQAQRTFIQYLSGTDKDHTVQWDFMCTTGRNSGK